MNNLNLDILAQISLAMEHITVDVKYVFFDIVGFSKIRPIIKQKEAILMLNDAIIKALTEVEDRHPPKRILEFFKLSEIRLENFAKWSKIMLPTGDGMCVCLLDGDLTAHLELAKNVFNALEISDPARNISIRVGIHRGGDFLYKDPNGLPNVVGIGINYCQRVMDSCDSNSISVSESEFKHCFANEQGVEDIFHKKRVIFKHNELADVYQYKDSTVPRLSAVVHSIERLDVSNSLKELSTTVNSILDDASLSTLRTMKWRIKHEEKLLKGLADSKKMPFPIRTELAYRRFVFTNILDLLTEGYTYSTFSPIDFWLQEERASSKSVVEFVKKNVSKASEGVTIRRIILIPENIESNNTREARRIKKSIIELYKLLSQHSVNTNELLKRRSSKFDINKEKIINLFLIHNENVDAILQTNDFEKALPNAYIFNEDQTDKIVVELKDRGPQDEPTRVNLDFNPADSSKFRSHLKIYSALSKRAIAKNKDLIALISKLSQSLD